MIILGAGLAGCIAAHLFPGSKILEAGSADKVIGAHKALLRFRSDALSKITGVPFRRVKVHKAVVSEGKYYLSEVPPYLQNWYSRKVTGAIADRSISNLAPVDRWIAPDNFHEQLVDRIVESIQFSWPVETVSPILICQFGAGVGIDRTDEPVLSTIPLPAMLKAARMEQDHLAFVRAPIHVQRKRVKRCDVHQTVYFPDPNLNVYRASITSNLLIMECVKGLPEVTDIEAVLWAFGLSGSDLEPVMSEISMQQYGKIVPLQDDARHAILLRLSREMNVYSFGRFGTWRNLLLDDLPADAEKIRMLMRMSDYEATLEGAR